MFLFARIRVWSSYNYMRLVYVNQCVVGKVNLKLEIKAEKALDVCETCQINSKGACLKLKGFSPNACGLSERRRWALRWIQASDDEDGGISGGSSSSVQGHNMVRVSSEDKDVGPLHDTTAGRVMSHKHTAGCVCGPSQQTQGAYSLSL